MSSINRDSVVPLYHQVKQALLDEIQTGVYGDGEPLPSEKELQKIYGVSRITVRRALSDLANAGYLTRQPGRGTFATTQKIRHRSGKIGGFLDDLASEGFEVAAEVLEYCHVQSPEEVARRLGIGADQTVLFTKQLVYANGEPVALGYVHHNYPEHVTFSPEELAADSAINLLRQKYDLVVRHAERTTQLALATEEEAEILGIAPGDSLFEVDLLVFDEYGSGLIHTRSLYRSDRYLYHETIRL